MLRPGEFCPTRLTLLLRRQLSIQVLLRWRIPSHRLDAMFQTGYVRGELTSSGWVIRPLKGGCICEVFYVLFVNPKVDTTVTSYPPGMASAFHSRKYVWRRGLMYRSYPKTSCCRCCVVRNLGGCRFFKISIVYLLVQTGATFDRFCLAPKVHEPWAQGNSRSLPRRTKASKRRHVEMFLFKPKSRFCSFCIGGLERQPLGRILCAISDRTGL